MLVGKVALVENTIESEVKTVFDRRNYPETKGCKKRIYQPEYPSECWENANCCYNKAELRRQVHLTQLLGF